MSPDLPAENQKYSRKAWTYATCIWVAGGLAFAFAWHAYFGDTFMPELSPTQELSNIASIPFLFVWAYSWLWLVKRIDRHLRSNDRNSI